MVLSVYRMRNQNFCNFATSRVMHAPTWAMCWPAQGILYKPEKVYYYKFMRDARLVMLIIDYACKGSYHNV